MILDSQAGWAFITSPISGHRQVLHHASSLRKTKYRDRVSRCRPAQLPTATQTVSMKRDKFRNNDPSEPNDAVLKLIWTATEWFGNMASLQSQPTPPPAGAASDVETAFSKDEVIRRLKQDFSTQYFITGQMDAGIYEPDCIFADPFTSFKGLSRFQNNLQRLTGFIENSKVKLLEFQVEEGTAEQDGNGGRGSSTVVVTRALVLIELNLVWKPRLNWVWGVKFFLDRNTNRIKRHEESWEVSAWEGVRQLFKPGNKPSA